MPTVTFVKEKKSVEVPDGANLRKVAIKAGVDVYEGLDKVLHCPGLGLCTTCKVHVKKGQQNVSKQGFWEKLNILKHPVRFFARLGREEELRLSCQTCVHGDVEVETNPAFNWHGDKFWG